MIRPTDKNLGIDPRDPEYDSEFDYDKAIAQYELEREMEEDDRRY